MTFITELPNRVQLEIRNDIIEYFDDYGIEYTDSDIDEIMGNKLKDIIGSEMLSTEKYESLLNYDNNEKYLHDTEYEKFYTLSEVESLYNELFRNGETELETFKDYLKDCTSKNGILEWC